MSYFIPFKDVREYLEKPSCIELAANPTAQNKKVTRFKVICTALLINLAIVMVFITILVVVMIVGGAKKPNRAGYRKVIKEGLLWDSVEWHQIKD
jgi:hypothetical protein